jgi:hypothetical protein
MSQYSVLEQLSACHGSISTDVNAFCQFLLALDQSL